MSSVLHVVLVISLYLSNMLRLYHKKDSNTLYIISWNARRSGFLILHLYICLRFNYKVRYVSGSPDIVLQRDFSCFRSAFPRPTPSLSRARDDQSTSRIPQSRFSYARLANPKNAKAQQQSISIYSRLLVIIFLFLSLR